jgi:bifunctional non-homologous end joining protein LigD
MTGQYDPLAKAAAELPADTAIIDGEMIVTNDDGISDFSALRSAIVNAPERLVFVAFDLLHLNGHDLRQMTLLERRHMLEDLVEPAEGPIQFSHKLDASANAVFRAVEKMGLEGMVSKRIDSRYRSGPSREWMKAKCYEESDFDLLGVRRERGKPATALMAERNGKRQYAGSAFVKVNSDFRQRLWDRVKQKAGPAPKGIAGDKTGVEWVKPGLVGRVRYMRGEETLRHATLKDVREE